MAWLQVKAGARYSGVSERTFRMWLKSKGLRHSKVGGVILINTLDIDEFIGGFSVQSKENMIDSLVDESLRGMI